MGLSLSHKITSIIDLFGSQKIPIAMDSFLFFLLIGYLPL